MRAGQKLNGNNGKQVALFPLEYMSVSQADDETYSHESWYYATDYLGWNSEGRVYHCPCYAPVDIKCIYVDTTECMAVWESLQEVNILDCDSNDTKEKRKIYIRRNIRHNLFDRASACNSCR